jgi:hypothetical protein
MFNIYNNLSQLETDNIMKLDTQKHYVAVTLLSLLLLRILVLGASIGDSIALLAISAFTGYSLYLQHRNRDIEQTHLDKLNKLEASYNELHSVLTTEFKEKSTYLQSELNILKQQVGIIKIDNGFNPTIKNTLNKGVSSGEPKRYF